MDPSSRTRRISVGGGGAVVAAGSVWEARMQSDDEVSVNNAIVNATHLLRAVDGGDKSSSKQMSLKRPAWKTDVKLARPRSIGATPPATPKRFVGATPPMTPRRSISSDLNDKSLALSVAVKKARSDSVEGGEKTPGRVKKTRSELCAGVVKSGELDAVALRRVDSLPKCNKETEDVDAKTEEVDVKTEETVDEKKQITEEVKELDVCQAIVVFADSKEDEQIDNGDGEEEEGEEEEEEKEVEKKSVAVKEMNAHKETSNNRVADVEIKKYSQSPATVRKLPPLVMKKAASVHPVPPGKGS